jgi:hypothetical protein
MIASTDLVGMFIIGFAATLAAGDTDTVFSILHPRI